MRAKDVDKAVEKSFNDWMHNVSRAAILHCIPEGMYAGAEGAKKFARECGVAIADFGEYGEKNIGSTYGAVCVIAYRLKPPIDSKVWISEMHNGYQRELERRKERGIGNGIR